MSNINCLCKKKILYLLFCLPLDDLSKNCTCIFALRNMFACPKNFKWTGMAKPFWVGKYVICFSSEIYFLSWNGIPIFILHFTFIWEWKKTRCSKFWECRFMNTFDFRKKSILNQSKNVCCMFIIDVKFNFIFLLLCYFIHSFLS